MRRLPAATPVVGRCSISRVIAQCTVSQCIVTTDGPGEPLTPRSASTSPGIGAWSEPKSCEIGLCVPNVRLLGASLRLGLWTTSCRLKTVERGLIAPTCSLSASHATTARRQKSRLAGARPPRGVKSLRLGGGDARVSPNFCACKLKQGGVPLNKDLWRVENLYRQKLSRSKGRCKNAEPIHGNRNPMVIWLSRRNT